MELLKWIQVLFEDYGYIVLFLGLVLEFIALPFPGETTMAYAGYLSYMGKLNFGWLLVIAFLGTTIGITITYFVGLKAGLPFIRRYGKWVLLSENKIERAQKWFNKYGQSLVFIGYFIPGVRHFTGYFSGIIAVPFRKFALYAYSGALVWVIVFVGVGKFFGPQWNYAFHLVEKYSIWVIAAIIALVIALIIYRCRKSISAMFSKLKRKSKAEPLSKDVIK
ncbi:MULTISPECIES: DedA family protein [Paenibacillus]|uniref:Alkaline phosphatase n=1 Tax=Paenibacillus azoreducens TaxID=116718 RepID=A0A919YN11_9BACL|nr:MULTISPECIES: DedA family protein [Paenibacillus]MBE9917840.1 DedA family protein [Paenibacillus donghaensis]GIO51600.1 alkaline phosphatase [Paenibacillus azoreducens]